MDSASPTRGEGKKETRSALGVAHPGADHTVAAAELVAVLRGGVLRAAERVGGGPAVRAADIGAVDRERRAGVMHGRNHAASRAAAFVHRAALGRREAGIVERIAEGAALSRRERAGRIRLGCADEYRERGKARQHWQTHGNPP